MDKEVKKTVDEDIDPEDIKMDDADMPEPKTKQYEQTLLLTRKFMDMFMDAIGQMKYSTVLKNAQGSEIKLPALVRFVEQHQYNGMTVNEMNTILSFISNSEYKYVSSLMEIVEDKKRQSELWELKKA